MPSGKNLQRNNNHAIVYCNLCGESAVFIHRSRSSTNFRHALHTWQSAVAVIWALNEPRAGSRTNERKKNTNILEPKIRLSLENFLCSKSSGRSLVCASVHCEQPEPDQCAYKKWWMKFERRKCIPRRRRVTLTHTQSLTCRWQAAAYTRPLGRTK